MLEIFYPDERVDSAYDIDYEKYYKEGFRGIIYDIDNTLVPHGKPACRKTIRLFIRLKRIGFQTCFLSNNQIPRVEMFNKEIQTLYICDAHKPAGKNYYRAMELMGTTPENTLYIGDQIFTDVWGAKRIGIHSILTRPLRPREEIQIILKRKLEWIVLKSFERNQKKKMLNS